MLRAHRKSLRQFAPSGGSYTPPTNGSSGRISVLGQRKHGSALGADTQPSLLRLKQQRLMKEQLLDIQRMDTDRDNAAMAKLLTPNESSTLSELQQEIAGGEFRSKPSEDESPPLNHNFTALMNEEDLIVEDDDSDSAWEDVIENTGNAGRSVWSNRVTIEHHAWLETLPALCDAYLEYRANESQPLAPSQTSGEVLMFSIRCIDLVGESTKTFKHPTGSVVNATLLHNGYLGCSPDRPVLAISILVLRVLAAVLRRGPSVSLQVMSKVFCNLRNVPYQPYFRVQLTSALDAFQMIRREQKRRLRIAMGENLEIHTACAACMYKLKNEPNLCYSMLVTCDGNDSLKRCAAAARADLHCYESDYFISREQVNQFQHEVPTWARKHDDSSDGNGEYTECEKRWKNAKVNNDPNKKTKTMFEETGVFVCSCRHGFVLFVCDMVRSGEQVKYGLGIIDKLIETYGENIMMGYDIGCTFKGTAERSRLLGPHIKESQFDMCVGSFHGPAHNRRCQLRYHPHNIPGTGLTNFENCETIFSLSNRIAGSTRLSSAYHRHQRIDNHFDGMNDDAHQNLGSLLCSKYNMALKEHDEASAILSRLSSSTPSNVLDIYFQMECDYLDSLTVPPPEDLIAVEYLNLLECLELKEKEYAACQNAPFVAVEGSSTTDLRRSTLCTARHESRRRTTLDQLVMIQDELERFENRHKISSRWTRFNTEWANADRTRKNRHFQECIDELERLIIQ
ncbi:hypothetical protein FRC11_002288 [Ceratobasidium sp. 423]|nr:hypothetical protein FRC11_002288 [Ceratobasidium sp. 423]